MARVRRDTEAHENDRFGGFADIPANSRVRRLPPDMNADMRALVLNGALGDDPFLGVAEEMLNAALASRGWAVESIPLRERPIAYCQGCFECWTKTPGSCKTHDGANSITRSLVRSDLLVLLTPVTFGGYSSELKKALDRSIAAVLPYFTRIDGEVHHGRRYTRYPKLLGIGIAPDDDEEERRVFSALVARNAINFHAPAHAAGVVSRIANREQLAATIGTLVGTIDRGNRSAA
jgi:NADPH-dependent FMN reductase